MKRYSGAHAAAQEKKKKARKRLSGWLIAFFVLMGLTLVLGGTALAIWLHGRSAVSAPAAAPVIPSQPVQAAEPEPSDPALLDSYTVRYNGKLYRYNENMYNILLIGVDADNKPSKDGSPDGEGYRADVNILAAMDLEKGDVTLIAVSRDSMCEIETLDENGQHAGSVRAQLALSFAYGDGLMQSCELTRDAVSNLFFGLQIRDCAAFYLGGVEKLNDAVGGVPVTVGEDYPFSNIPGCENMTAGSAVTLSGNQARLFIQARTEDEVGNLNRMTRQKQFLLSFIDRVKGQIAEKPGSFLPLYDAVKDYVVTDMSIDRLAYLATQAAKMHFSGEIRSLDGELRVSEENTMELTVDTDDLTQLMLDVFYVEVEQ